MLIGGACDGQGTGDDSPVRHGGGDYGPPVGVVVDEPTPSPSPLGPPAPMQDMPEPVTPAAVIEGREAEQQGVVAAGTESPQLGGASSAAAAFLAGYRAGGGDPAWEEHLIDVVQCESEWVLDPPGSHLGLAQFESGTWVQARCSPDADYTDPFDQGCAVARWMATIAPNYGSTAGWPGCW